MPISNATSTPSKQNKVYSNKNYGFPGPKSILNYYSQILPKPSISNTSSSVITTESTMAQSETTIASQQQNQTQLNTSVSMHPGNNPQQQSNQPNAFNPCKYEINVNHHQLDTFLFLSQKVHGF